MQVVSDASGFKAAICYEEDQSRVVADFRFSEAEKRFSSGHRELLSVHKMVEHWVHTRQMFERQIYWMTDSMNVVSFLEKGSSKPHIQNVVFDLACNFSILNTVVQPVHLYRSDVRIMEADI